MIKIQVDHFSICDIELQDTTLTPKELIDDRKKNDPYYREDIEVYVKKEFSELYKINKKKNDLHHVNYAKAPSKTVKAQQVNNTVINIGLSQESYGIPFFKDKISDKNIHNLEKENLFSSSRLDKVPLDIFLPTKKSEPLFSDGSQVHSKNKIDEEFSKTIYFGNNQNRVSFEPTAILSSHSKMANSSPAFNFLSSRLINLNKVKSVKDIKIEPSIKYPFQSWGGEHSVKISMPKNNSQQSSIILQASDLRTSDIISRQLASIASLNPEMLMPQRDRQHHQGQNQHDSEQQDDESC